jgi:hypothetical protein
VTGAQRLNPLLGNRRLIVTGGDALLGLHGAGRRSGQHNGKGESGKSGEDTHDRLLLVVELLWQPIPSAFITFYDRNLKA